MDLTALTLHQPWADLWARGHKIAETRSAPLAGDMCPPGVRPLPGRKVNRGDRLAVAAAASVPTDVRMSLRDHGKAWNSGVRYRFDDLLGPYSLEGRSVGTTRALPLGAIVGIATIIDCVPIASVSGDPHLVPVDRAIIVASDRSRAWHKIGDTLADFTDQLPFGDYTPGRWAILSRNATKLAMPVPAKGRRGTWAVPDDVAALVRHDLTTS